MEFRSFLKKNPVTALLVAANIVFFFIVEATGRSQDAGHMIHWGACYLPLIQEGEWYRVITSLFLHFGMSHLANNMIVLAVLGTRLEPVIGHAKMLFVYLMGGIGGNLVSLFLESKTGDYAISAGASGATFALMGGVLLCALRNHGRLQDLGMRQILIMAALSLYLGFSSEGVDNAAHVGGLLCGFLLSALVYQPWPDEIPPDPRRRRYGNGVDEELWRRK